MSCKITTINNQFNDLMLKNVVLDHCRVDNPWMNEKVIARK
jgi:c-di-AMP phosphodiesterase-like protein